MENLLTIYAHGTKVFEENIALVENYNEFIEWLRKDNATRPITLYTTGKHNCVIFKNSLTAVYAPFDDTKHFPHC